MRFSICAVALLLLGALPGGVRGAKRKKATDWNTVGWDDLEETWKDGDADDELITDDQLLYKEMERRREQGPPMDFKDMPPEDIKASMVHGQSMTGPAMMFVELKKVQKDGETAWDKESVEKLAMEWRELLFTGGFSVSVYAIEELKILVTLQKGWEGKGVKDFIVDQPDIAKVTWDSMDYLPGQTDEAFPLPPSHTKAAAPKPKKKRKKKAAAAAEANGGGGGGGGVDPVPGNPGPTPAGKKKKKANAASSSKQGEL